MGELMIEESRKVFYFDLSVKKLKMYFSSTNPNYAYKLIEMYMLDNGFSHRQFSGYMSQKEMSIEEGISFCKTLGENFPWLKMCVEKFDMTTVPVVYDMNPYLGNPIKKDFNMEFYLEQTYEKVLIDYEDEYRLYKSSNGEYVLFDEYDNEVGITDCDNIEEALEELREKEQDLEL